MKKMLVVFTLVFVALVAMPKTASAQYAPNWYTMQQQMACAQDPYCAKYLYRQQMRQMGIDPRMMQGGLYNPYGWQSQMIPGYGQMLQYPYGSYQGYYGRIVQNAGGNPYFDALVVPCQIAEKSNRWQKGVAITAIGTVVGGLIGQHYDHPVAGALTGAALGGSVALINNTRYCSAPEQIQLPVQQQQMGVGQPMTYQQNPPPVSYQEQVPSAPAPVSTPAPTTSVTTAVSGSGAGEEFSLANGTRFRLEVFYDGKFIGRMGRPGVDPGAQSMAVAYPEQGKVYTAMLIVPNVDGGISSVPAKILPGDTGITFTDPTEGGR